MSRSARILVALLTITASTSVRAEASGEAELLSVRDAQTPSPGGAGKPRAVLVDKEDFSLALRGFGQFTATPWVGEDALVDNGDAADFAGLRVRRLNIGLEGRVGTRLSFDVWVDLASGPLLTQARLAWTFRPELTLEAGVLKIPLSRSALQSSAELLFHERPLSVNGLTAERQPGIAAYGALFDGLLSYRAGVFNGADIDRAALGNDHPGALFAGRVAVSPLGTLRPGQTDFARGDLRIEVAASAFYDLGPAFDSLAFGGDVFAQGYGATLLVEYLQQTRTPISRPITSPGVADRFRRSGLIAQASYLFWENGLELALRAERSDDNDSLEDVGDTDALSAGLRWHLGGPHLRIDLDWYHRSERFGSALANDAVVLSTQGRF